MPELRTTLWDGAPSILAGDLTRQTRTCRTLSTSRPRPLNTRLAPLAAARDAACFAHSDCGEAHLECRVVKPRGVSRCAPYIHSQAAAPPEMEDTRGTGCVPSWGAIPSPPSPEAAAAHRGPPVQSEEPTTPHPLAPSPNMLGRFPGSSGGRGRGRGLWGGRGLGWGVERISKGGADLPRRGSPRWAVQELNGGRPSDGPVFEHSRPLKWNTRVGRALWPPARIRDIMTSHNVRSGENPPGRRKKQQPQPWGVPRTRKRRSRGQASTKPGQFYLLTQLAMRKK